MQIFHQMQLSLVELGSLDRKYLLEGASDITALCMKIHFPMILAY